MIPLLCRVFGGHQYVTRSSTVSDGDINGPYYFSSTGSWRECVRCGTPE